MRPGRRLLLILVCAWGVTAIASAARACYTIVVGKEASADGSVLLAHNEQCGERLVSLRVVPRIKHEPGSVVRLLRGGTLPQVPETYAFIWSHIPGHEFCDSCLNEWGVAVVSNGCASREDSYEELVARGDIVDGGIGIMLRRLVALRARTAREGVEIAGELIERFGYSGSGHTYLIADPNQGWLLSVVAGRHWVAQRVPDDGVVLQSGVPAIREVDLKDADNFLAAPDLIEYAVERGWFDPRSGEPFSYRAAYSAWETKGWDPRQWRGQYMLTGQPPDPAAGQLPFSVKPQRPLGVKDVIAVLRYHSEEGICFPGTQEASVFQLRSWVPPQIGCVYWRVSAEPCVGLVVPWYLGIAETPAPYYAQVDLREQLTLSYHLNPSSASSGRDSTFVWWKFKALQDLVNAGNRAAVPALGALWGDLETAFFAQQPAVEARALELFSQNPETAGSYLTRYSGHLGLQAAALTDQVLAALKAGAPLPTKLEVAPFPDSRGADQ